MERWLPVRGFEGSYEVSDHGRVRSLPRAVRCRGNKQRMLSGKVVKGRVGKNGYIEVALQRRPHIEYVLAHRLVLETFKGSAPEGCEARHRDGDRLNNTLDNLLWGTRVDNMADQYVHGTRIMGETHPNAVFNGELVRWIRESPQSSYEIAKVLGVNHTNTWRVKTGKTWQHVSP